MKSALRYLVLALVMAAGLDAGATVSVLPGSSPQTINNGDYFAPMRVRVTDATGLPVAGAFVYWKLPYFTWAILAHESHANCVAEPEVGDTCTAVTGDDGTATMNTSYAVYAGSYTIRVFARASNAVTELGFADVNLTVRPERPPATLREFGQSNRVAPRGSLLPRPFIAQMLNADNTPRAGVPVTFSRGDISPAGASGYFAGNATATVVTDGDGYAEAPEFRITNGLGLGRIVARALDTTANAVVEVNFYFTSTTLEGASSLAVEDIWWAGPEENGWGLSIAQRGEQLFAVLFVYDNAGLPTWYALDQGAFASDALYERFVGRLYSPRGSPYFAYNAAQFAPGGGGAAGEMTFYTETDATLRIIYPDRAVQKPIRPFDFAGNSFPPFPNLTGTWWAGPSQNGWAVAMSERNGTIFAVWYTYDENGNRTWFSMPTGTWTSHTVYEGTMYQTRGPRWPDYDPTALVVTPVGQFAFTFQNSSSATFDWRIGTRSQRTQLQRYVP